MYNDTVPPEWELTSSGIKITPKEKLVEDMGRSPDKGDAVVMAWSDRGNRFAGMALRPAIRYCGQGAERDEDKHGSTSQTR